MNELEKELYFKLTESCKEYILNDIKKVFLLKHILPEDILWLIATDICNEVKKEPTYEFCSENGHVQNCYVEYSTYKWPSNSTRTKYNLPTTIQFTYNYPLDEFYNYQNLEKKTYHNIKSIIDIVIEINYTNEFNVIKKYIGLEYDHDNSDILDADVILNKSKLIWSSEL